MLQRILLDTALFTTLIKITTWLENMADKGDKFNEDVLLLGASEGEELDLDDKFDKIKSKTRGSTSKRLDPVVHFTAQSLSTSETDKSSAKEVKANPGKTVKPLKRKSSGKVNVPKPKTSKYTPEEVDELKDQMGISLMSRNISGLTNLVQSLVTTLTPKNVPEPNSSGVSGPPCTTTAMPSGPSTVSRPPNVSNEGNERHAQPVNTGFVDNSRPILSLNPNLDDIDSLDYDEDGYDQNDAPSENFSFDPVQGFADALNVNPPESYGNSVVVNDDPSLKEDDDAWVLPQLQSEEKTGPKVSTKLAEAIDAAVTKRSNKDSIKDVSDKYFRPENCKNLTVPKVNKEIWSALCKTAHEVDIRWQEVQKSFASGLIPLVQLADMLSCKSFDASKARTLLTDAFSLLGHSFLSISQKRRVHMKQFFNDKYKPMCNSDVEVDAFLFGTEGIKKLKELGDPQKVPIGHPRYLRRRFSVGNHGGGHGSYGSYVNNQPGNARGPAYKQGNQGRGRGQSRGYHKQMGRGRF